MTETVGRLLNMVVVAKVKHLLGTIVVLFIMFGLITWQVRSLVERDRQGDLRDAALVTYQVELDAYNTALAQYESCLTRIETRTIYRERFIQSALTKRAIIEAIQGDREDTELYLTLYDIVDNELDRIEADLPALDRDVCPAQPPARPEPPIS